MSLRLCTVLVTPTSFGRHDAILRAELEAAVGCVRYNAFERPLRADELRRAIGDVDGLIAGLDEVDRQVIEAAPRLKVIARYGVGIDNIDLAAAAERGVVVTNTPGANSGAVAELAVGLMLALGRGIPFAAQSTRAGEWPRPDGWALEGRTVGLLGLGAVGKRVATILRGFGCRVLAYDPQLDHAFASQHHVEACSLDVLLARSDIVSLHLPATPATRQLAGAAFLARMKQGAALINTARGELVDEDALVDALRSGRLSGAALDTLTREPPPADHPLLALPQVIVTPHIGAHTDQATIKMGRAALADCLAVLRGDQPAHRVPYDVAVRAKQ